MPTKTKEVNEEKNIKEEIKKETKNAAKNLTTMKKQTNLKKVTTKTEKKGSISKKVTSTAKKTIAKKVTKKEKHSAEVVEYYDLPYRYNETIVKILYQTPDTLFVYWDISDNDRENYVKEYGKNFFNITRPVLIVHNDTMNYSFEIPINDFANSWYLHINDSKCNYRVELGRRPNYYSKEVEKEIQENIHTDYIYVSDSNKIESPNDHVLFNTNENNTIKYRNVKNNEQKSISIFDIIKHFPGMKKSLDIPYISEDLLKAIYSGIYNNEDISLFDRISNPSSFGNPSSGSLSSRFI